MEQLDTYSQHGAGVLASRIEDYWRGRGFKGIRAERYPLGDSGLWGVRSNIGPLGWPPRAASIRDVLGEALQQEVAQ